jgi:hypothetical protein
MSTDLDLSCNKTDHLAIMKMRLPYGSHCPILNCEKLHVIIDLAYQIGGREQGDLMTAATESAVVLLVLSVLAICVLSLLFSKISGGRKASLRVKIALLLLKLEFFIKLG